MRDSSHIPVNANARSSICGPTRAARVPALRLAFIACALLVTLSALLEIFRIARFDGHADKAAVHSADASLSSQSLTDRYGDGTPEFLRLTDPADQAAFRRWFTLIAEYQAVRPKGDVPAEISDCASLLRYAYRETLKRHNEAWFAESGIEIAASQGEIRAWTYPYTPLGAALFRTRPGAFAPSNLQDGTFSQFADARTLIEHNSYSISHDVRMALPGDLLFYRQFGQSSPWHSMIVTRGGRYAAVVYHTGPDHGHPGELRRVALAELLDHPEIQWRPVAANPNFLGVYRWNILRGAP